MQASNLSWLEVEARYQVGQRTATSRLPRRRTRRPAVSFPPPATPRRVIGQRLLALGKSLVQPRPVGPRSAT